MASITYCEKGDSSAKYVRGVLVYSISQTETSVTLTARSKLQVQKKYLSGYTIETILAGSSVSSKTDYIRTLYNTWNDSTVDTGDYSKTYTKTHSAQPVVLKSRYYGEGSGGYIAGIYSGSTDEENKSVTISIPAKASYTVSYNANGGSGAPASETKWYGENLTLSSTKPTRTNYVFLGWSTSSTATTATYAAGGTYSANSAATLYAVWKLNAYTVSYNKGANGSGTNTTDTKIHGTALTLKGAIFTRTGYTQTGWSTSDGGSKTYNLSASYTTNAAVTLYPFWTINSWTVSYNLNGGSGTFNSQTKYYNTTLTLRTGSPTKASASAGSYTVSYNANGGSVSPTSATAARTTSYSFSKWNTAANGSGTNYNSGGSYTANAGATLYAQYTGSTSTASVTLPTPTRTGYTFAGWYTAQSGGTPIEGTSYTPSGTVTLYAHWNPVTYTISYSASGASNVPSPQSQTRDQYMTVTTQKPTKTDHVFNGWDTSNAASTVRVTPGQKYMPNANTTLYAVFTLNYSEPMITNVTAVRCNSSGTSQDDGTYVKVGCSWSTFSTNYKATKIEIFYKRTNASSWTTGYTNNSPGASSGTVSQVIGGGNINAEDTYNVQIKVTDSVDNGTYTTFVSSAFFAIDQGTAGKSLGFGMSALDSNIPSNGRADFGMDAHFNAEVYDQHNKKLNILTPYHITTANMLSAAGWYRAYKITFGTSAQSIGARGTCIDFVFGSVLNDSNNTVHRISLYGFYNAMEFKDETSKGADTTAISKIRYMTDGNGVGYIDIYYNLSTANDVNGSLFAIDSEEIASIEDMGFASVGLAPSGETLKAEYTFKSNYNEYDDRYYKVGDTTTIAPGIIQGLVLSSGKIIRMNFTLPKRLSAVSSVSISNLTGGFANHNGLVETSGYSTNFVSSSTYTVTATIREATAGILTIDVSKSTAFVVYGGSAVPQNTPIIGFFSTLSLTFS